jgi:hypothetical protein
MLSKWLDKTLLTAVIQCRVAHFMKPFFEKELLFIKAQPENVDLGCVVISRQRDLRIREICGKLELPS